MKMNNLNLYRTDSNNFFNELTKVCKDNKITAYKLSKYTNLSMTYSYNLLNGKMKKPSLNTMKKIIEGFEKNNIKC